MLSGLASGMQTLARLRIQFDETDVAEVRAIGQPHRAVGRIAHHARIDRVAVLDAVGPDDRAGVLPFVIRRGRIQRAPDEQADRPLSAASPAQRSRESICRRSG